jgi:hypothetical protein
MSAACELVDGAGKGGAARCAMPIESALAPKKLTSSRMHTMDKLCRCRMLGK